MRPEIRKPQSEIRNGAGRAQRSRRGCITAGHSVTYVNEFPALALVVTCA
jgi:hypothetical protein